MHDEEWWKNIKFFNIIGFDNEMCDDNLEEKPGNWVAYAVYLSEPFHPITGYRVLFPTPTDCLYWIRWLVLPEACMEHDLQDRKEIVLTGKAKEIADIIDQASDKTPSVDLILRLRNEVRKWMSEENKDIFFIGPVEEHKKSIDDL